MWILKLEVRHPQRQHNEQSNINIIAMIQSFSAELIIIIIAKFLVLTANILC